MNSRLHDMFYKEAASYGLSHFVSGNNTAKYVCHTHKFFSCLLSLRSEQFGAFAGLVTQSTSVFTGD